jgi:anti-sigma B factor antagonist
MAPLQVDQETQGRLVTLRTSGELDLASAPHFEAAIKKTCERPERQVILDLSGVSFIDTGGVRAILTARRIFEETDCGFWMMGLRAPVRRVLERCGVLDSLPLRD